MKPSTKKLLITLVVGAGLIFTYACGSDSSRGSGSAGGGSGSTDGVTITNEVADPASMSAGDIIMLQFSSSDPAELDFSGVASTSKYYLAVGSLSYNYSSSTVSVSSSESAIRSRDVSEDILEEDWNSWTVQDAFNQRLMDVGMMMALDPDAEIAGSSEGVGVKASVSPKAVVGDTEEFRVLNSLSSMSSYRTVTGRIRCVEDNVVVYVDTEVESTNPGDLDSDDINMLCEDFNDQVTLEREWFGMESDVDGDGKVHALATPQVNRLGSMGGGIITGFFLSSDLYTRTVSNSISNEREIVYTLVPDSAGVYGTTLPESFTVDNLLTAVLPHELQHAISYNMHVFEGEGSPESNWLNEGMSHLTEDLVGFGQENYSRADIFLDSPSSYMLVSSGSPGLGERGGAYLFMRFLYEQHPNPTEFLWGLFHNDASGVANLEAAYDGSSAGFDQFGEFFMRWMTAVTMTNRGLSADTRYVYDPRTWNSSTDRWQGICLVCDADDGRGTTMNGPSMQTYTGAHTFSVYASSARYYNISSPPDEINFTTSSSGTFGAVLIRRE